MGWATTTGWASGWALGWASGWELGWVSGWALVLAPALVHPPAYPDAGETNLTPLATACVKGHGGFQRILTPDRPVLTHHALGPKFELSFYVCSH